jgi:hypothetical protein
MPTALTAGIIDGEDLTFEQFALRCARQFVPQLREYPLDQELPKTFEPDTAYYEKVKATAEAQLEAASKWSDADAQEASDNVAALSALRDEQREKEANENREKLEKVLAKAEAWEPPTPMHERYKEFMVEQIKGTIDQDGTHRSFGVQSEPQSAAHYRDSVIQSCKDEIERADARIAEVKERAKEATDWLGAVTESFDD